MVGGSGAVNGGYFCRGLPTDFDSWNLPGWAWDDVLPHFLAIETDLDFGGPLHGADGPMLIRRVAELEVGAASFVQAARDLGFGWIADFNGSTREDPLPPGVGAVPLNIDGGTRVGPGGAFLGPALGRPNLTVLDKTRVTRVRVSGGRAVGVECHGPTGRAYLSADRIVLSAGAIGSAQLLMLSGIGPAAGLKAAGVQVLVDLPVGTATRRPPGMGAAGGLARDSGSAAAGGDALHGRRVGDQVVHDGVRGDDRRPGRRPGRPAASRGHPDASSVAGTGHAGVGRRLGTAGDRAPLRQRTRRRRRPRGRCGTGTRAGRHGIRSARVVLVDVATLVRHGADGYGRGCLGAGRAVPGARCRRVSG